MSSQEPDALDHSSTLRTLILNLRFKTKIIIVHKNLLVTCANIFYNRSCGGWSLIQQH